jgi:galactokinase
VDAWRRREAIELEFAKLYGGLPTQWLRAPGRVDLMGSHTDYNDGHVLTMTVDRDTWIAVRPRDDRRVAIASLNLPGTADFSLDAIERDPAVPWTDYLRGAARVLQQGGTNLAGFDGLLHSSVPFGSGLSSSAAIEIATLLAFDAVSGSQHEPLELAILGQRVENEFVGVSCGILDQYTSVLGTAGHALLLDCRALRSRPVAIAADLAVVICDTRAPRQLAGSEYDERRAQCEAGATHIAASTAGAATKSPGTPTKSPGTPTITALRDVSLELFEAHEAELPAVVARRCRFILEEDQRVLELADVLPAGDRAALARLFDASFAGAVELFEIGAPSMLAMHAAMDGAPGLVARRQAGAGFGGCLVALVEREGVEAFTAHLGSAYAHATGIEPSIFKVEAAAGAGPLAALPKR